MSYANKKKGFREITVEGICYRWRLRTGVDDGRVTLQASDSGGQQAIIAVRGARDPWLCIEQCSPELTTVSPKIVRRMIQQALAAGWQPAQPGTTIKLNFEPAQ
jgi:hypothetical protein